jgi:predicted Zn finger-like uncharacterized protein
MTVTCPSCKRKFALEGSLVRSPYQKMRCSRCGHVFVHGQDHAKREERPLLSPPGIAVRVVPEKKRRGMRLFLLVLLAIAILAACAYFFLTNYWAGNSWLSIGKMEGQETVIKDGRGFLINGVVANHSTKARKYVILMGKLFDQQGAILAERPALAGLPLSADEVRQMSKSDIDRKVKEFRESTSLSTFVLYANKDLPFSIMFSDPYSGKPKEFTVEIVESPLL